jgi:hypothetical protein
MTYISWKRQLVLSTIDQHIVVREECDTDSFCPGPDMVPAEDVLRELCGSIPTKEIAATMDDLMTGHRNLCNPLQRQAMEALRQHLEMAIA